jgi:hypothetical protein
MTSPRIHHVEQGTDQWRELRRGKVTASRVADVIAKIKSGGYSTSRANYRTELMLERLTGRIADGFISQDMITGTLREPDARVEYELRMRCEVEQVGFVEHPTIPMSGASTDGFVGAKGMVEFKCPKPATHFDTLRTGVMPAAYLTQMDWNLACNPDREWCDYCSFNPDFPEALALYRKRVPRDDARIAGLEREVRIFQTELDADMAEISTMLNQRAAA